MKASKAFLFVFLIVLSLCLVDTQPVKPQPSGTVYIRSDGSVEGTDKIQRDGDVYTFTANIYDSIVVERNNIVVDGAGYTLQGTGAYRPKGIDLAGRSNVTIKNTRVSNTHYGIHLDESSNNNIIGNYITNNSNIALYSSSNNNVTGNTIANNNYGAYIRQTSNNVIYHNNFINNTNQAYNYESTNVWDNGYPSGGNYWSGYNGTDADQDGIGDSPYTIDANNTDNYPLMGMSSDFSATSEHHVQTICNSSISDFQFNETAICFNVSGEEGTTGFCRICIPTALMETYRVFVNGTEVPHTLLQCSNSTHSYLYFTYNHSTQEVLIVPEFLTWTPMLLILIVLTVAIAIYKRRLIKTPIH